MIQLQGVRKRYGERIVLDIPELSLESGQRYALIGPNGCGKSTLLRILAGTLRAEEGTVAMGDIAAGDVGYLPQAPYGFDRSVLRNVMLPLGHGPEAKKAALAALESVGMTHLAGAKGSRLSGGEVQRMALARVMTRPWKLLLMDEPTSAVDLNAGERIEEALLQYAAKHGSTMLFSCHAPDLALRLATRVLVMDGGKVVESGAVDAVLYHPQEEMTKRFLQHWKIS